jgi:DNA polymerase III subunit gamma/tau
VLLIINLLFLASCLILYPSMGKALYREYRPKSLKSVIGQEHITTTLRNAIDKGAISHAYLFTGPRGVGKTSVARILAHEINELPYDEENTQLDIIEIDAASNRRIDEIRELRDKVHIAPTSSKYKVYIIDEVHMLTREAFNALLKTLEEPPAHVVFILATTESHKVPDTIISRTQRFAFKSVSKDSVATHLRTIADKENMKITSEALTLLAEHGNGSFRDSISMLDQIAGFSHTEITAENIGTLLGVPDTLALRTLLTTVWGNDVEALFSSMQKLREAGSNPAKTAQLIIRLLRDDIVHKHKIDASRAVILMKNLLPLTGVLSSYEALEIALLEAIVFETPSAETKLSKIKQTKINKPEIPEAKKDIAPVTTPVRKSATVVAYPPEKQVAVITEAIEQPNKGSWEDVLNELKINNNTLYGVLRMAETKIEKNKILLRFQFDFHKKQLHQSKNIATLKAIIDKKLGRGFSVESEVSKERAVEPLSKKRTYSNDTLSSVSNIFAGAELLES